MTKAELDHITVLEESNTRLRSCIRRIEQALLPDPHDEREISVDWLRKEIAAAIRGSEREGGDRG